MKMNKSAAHPSYQQGPTLAADSMRNQPCVRNARNSTKRLSATESSPNQPPTSQQLIGSKNSLGTFTSRRSLSTPGQQNQKSKAASVGGLFHSSSFDLKLRPGYHSFRPQVPRPTLTTSPTSDILRVRTEPMVLAGSLEFMCKHQL
jgi:hypothetical protein